MWGNLQNVRNMAEKLSNVVAPREDDEESYEEYYEDEEEEESESASEPQMGFVGLLARAMDSKQESEEEEEVTEENGEADDPHNSTGIHTEPETPQQQQASFDPTEDDPLLEVVTVTQTDNSGSIPNLMPPSTKLELTRDSSDMSELTMLDLKPLVREAGSLSPANTTSSAAQSLKERLQATPLTPPLERYTSHEGHEERRLPDIREDETTMTSSRTEKLEKRCKELRRQLTEAQTKLRTYETATPVNTPMPPSSRKPTTTNGDADDWSVERRKFESERQQLQSDLQNYQQQLIQERQDFQKDQQHLQSLLQQATSQRDTLESDIQRLQHQHVSNQETLEQQHVRSLRNTEDRLASSNAQLAAANEQVERLGHAVRQLEAQLSEQTNGVQEAEDEMDELHEDNEQLADENKKLVAENEQLREQTEADGDKLVRLKMELRMLKEDRDRVNAKASNLAATNTTNTELLENERDQALAELQDARHQLAAAQADIQVAQADVQRVTTANANLQAALEAIQDEREAERELLEKSFEQQREAQQAAHEASLEAQKQVQLTEQRQMQAAADAAVQNSMEEIKSMEEKYNVLRAENVQTRRSLDEAIRRLQSTQDDVVDREYMKNILLDWLTKSDAKDREQILGLMASVLHFTPEEKDRVNISELRTSRRNLMAPPPSKADLEHLGGDNVREKFVNFLIAETED